ncbi:MAG: glycoside hydrolase family 113 [Acidimicrobiales bacterium]
MRNARTVPTSAPRSRRALQLAAALGLAGTAALGLTGTAARAVTVPATSEAPASRGPAVPAGITTVTDGTGGLTAGAAVPNMGSAADDRALARIKADGLNTVSLFVWWLTAGPTSDAVSPYQGTQSDASLDAEIRTARADGLAVSLTPVFYCSGCQGGWRGTMEPADATVFFAAYGAFIDHYATLAQRDGVSTFFVGSEMSSLETDTSQWRTVISGARSRFHGTLAYEENWDVLGQARFLSDVDLIGVSAYFPLDDEASPDLTRLLGDWTSSQSSSAPGSNWAQELAGLAQSTGRPIVFGEAGYMSGDFAARQPFLDFHGQADWQLQADLYQALLQTFSGRSWWKGVDWWEWFASSDAANDDSRSPAGKTAESLLKDWYAKGWRPAAPDQSLTLLASGRAAAPAPAARIESASAPSSVTIPGVVAPDSPLVLAGAGLPPGTGSGSAGAAPDPAYRGRLDGWDEAGLASLLVLLAGLGAAVWMTFGRAPQAR